MSLAVLFSLAMSVQVAGFALAWTFKTEKFYDLFGSLTFILCAYLSHSWSRNTLRQFVQSHLVMCWALRLGLFLFIRVLKSGGDSRFKKAKSDAKTFLVFWLIQGLWVFVTSLPTFVLNTVDADSPIGNRDIVGWALWVFGMILEVVADAQKSLFRANPENANKFIRSGLWSLSRHPNYFGEIVLWFGLYLSASSALRGWQLLTVMSPIAVYALLTRVSGIPILERSAQKRWGNAPEYQEYVKSTPVLIPFSRQF